MTRSTGYFDLQVNGYAGVDFNQDDLPAEAMHGACQQLQEDGVAGILATIITDDAKPMQRRLARIAQLREQDALVRELIAGIHIEGPFMSVEPGYVGAHPLDAVLPADVGVAEAMLEAAGGLTRIFTLAPEVDPGFHVTRMLADRGIVVSAGHTNAQLDELKGAIDSGLSMFTHLGNACPMHLHRHDNIIQRALSLADRLWISFIADGAHIAFPALGNYLRCAGISRCVIVSDAISAAGLGPGTYSIGPQKVAIGEDLVAWAEDRSHLFGSATIMPRAIQNLRDELSLSDDEIAQLTVENPRRVIGA